MISNTVVHDLKESHLKIKILIDMIQNEKKNQEYLDMLKKEAVKITSLIASITDTYK